jgi:hypothetical protein
MNIQNKIHLICGVLLLFLVMPLTALAADFTFNVPVNVQNQSVSIVSGEVQCNVLIAQQTFRNESIGEGVQLFTLDNSGSFQGTLTIAIFADDDPAEARTYTCELKLRDIDGNFVEGPGAGAGNRAATGSIGHNGPHS